MMNSFKRGIGYQIAKIVVSLAVAFIIALLTGKVHALTLGDLDDANKSSLYPFVNSYQFLFTCTNGNCVTNKDIPFDTNIYISGYNYAVFTFSINISSYSANSGSGNSWDYWSEYVSPKFELRDSSGIFHPCQLETGYAICPIESNKTYNLIRFGFAGPDQTSNTIYFNGNVLFSRTVYFYNKLVDSTSTQIANNTSQINNSINNDSVGTDNENSSKVSEWSSSTAQNGTITQLITLPITLYTSILNNINGSCTSFSLGSLYGSNLTMSCINIQDYVGSNLWSAIDILFSGFFILIISKKMIKVFNNISSMKEGDILD